MEIRRAPKSKTKKLFLFLALPIFLTVFFVTDKKVLATEHSVIITKVLYNPAGSDNKTDPESFESIVLKNTSSNSVDISTWEIRLGTYFSLSKIITPVPAGKTLTIYLGTGSDSNLDFTETTEAALFVNKSGSQLGDKKGEISLYKSPSHTKDMLVDYVAYGNKSTSTNYEQALLAKLWAIDDFAPLVEEDCFIELEEKIKNNSSDWKSNCPEKKEEESGPIKISLDDKIYENIFADFKISGLSQSAKVVWTFGDNHKSYKQKTRHKYNTAGTYAASVKYPSGNQEVIENFTVIVKKIPHPEVKIISINANPAGKDADNETIILQNKSKKKVNLKGWSIATGWEKLVNHSITKDFEIKKGKEKEITREFSLFTLNNKKSEVELRYPDGKIADSIKYNKKKETVIEGEIYQKEKGKKWKWVAPPKTASLAKNTVIDKKDTENISLPENKSLPFNLPQEIKIEPEIDTKENQKTSKELLGHFSPRKNQKQNIEKQLLSFNDSKANPKFTQKLKSWEQGFVFGTSITKNARPKNDEAFPEHILKSYFYKINLYLNEFILKLQN